MRRRQINIPVLDQTATATGQPHWFGGILATWTEEGTSKTQYDATFRQVSLVAHKLVCYTRSSDELLDDSAIALEALLRGPMGFVGAINWYEEYAFLQGTGAGQPLGVINAGATITIAAQQAPPAPATIYTDLVNMLEAFLPGANGVWYFNQRHLSDLMLANGPAGNASYLWGSMVNGQAPSILGYPYILTEKLPGPGTTGSILLADPKYYLIGDREATTIDTNVWGARFQYDETEWRAVHRVDGQPWLSTPLTLQDGVAQVSPFVILGAKST
jgi:HK97 family phage major capsid protein